MQDSATGQEAGETRPGGISREELADLFRRNDVLAAAHVGARFCFHAGMCAAALYAIESGRWLLAFLLAVPQLASMSFLGWAGIGHELYHNTVFTNRRLNKALYWLCSVLSWSNPGYFQVSHPYHHRATLGVGDVEGIPPRVLGPRERLLLWTFDGVSFYRRVRILILNAFGIVPGGAAGATMFPERSAARASLFGGARAVLIVQGGLATLFLLMNAGWLLVLVNLAPFCITWPNRTLAIMQHYGLPGAERDYYRSCRTVLLNPVTAFFYANMNYHLEHHFYPGVPFYSLPRMNRIFRARTPYANLADGYRDGLRVLKAAGLFGVSPPR